MKFTINNKKFLIEFLKNEIVEIGIKDGKSYPTKYGKYVLYIAEGDKWEKLIASLTYDILYRVAYKIATHQSIPTEYVPEYRESAA